jgi:hypothetical protein
MRKKCSRHHAGSVKMMARASAGRRKPRLFSFNRFLNHFLSRRLKHRIFLNYFRFSLWRFFRVMWPVRESVSCSCVASAARGLCRHFIGFCTRAGKLPDRGTALTGGITLARFTFKTWIAVFACAAGMTAASVSFTASAETVLNAKNSWIGNTFGFGDGTWTQINITAIAVAPDGKVYTNAPWDESGAEASVYQNGKMLGFAGGTHGWGNGGGNAIAVNRKYAFVAISVGNEKGHLVEQGVWPERASNGSAFRAGRSPIRSAPRRSSRPQKAPTRMRNWPPAF